MKKQVLKQFMLFAALSGAQLDAYTLSVRNDSKKPVELTIRYAQKRLCKPEIVKLNPNQSKKINHVLCCISGLQVRPLTSEGPQGPFLFAPSRMTGLGDSCANNKMRIVDVPDGTLQMENDVAKRFKGHYLFVKNNTDLPLQLFMRYWAAGVCPDELAQVAPHGTLIHQTGRGSGILPGVPAPGAAFGCCLSLVKARATGGPRRSQEWYQIEFGAGKRCQDISLEIEQNPDDTLHIERIKQKK